MGVGKFNAIPVIEESGKVKGIISTTDIIKCFLDENDEENIPLITNKWACFMFPAVTWVYAVDLCYALDGCDGFCRVIDEE